MRPLKMLFTLALPVAVIGAAGAWALGLLDFGKRDRTGIVYETADVAKGTVRRIVSTSGPVRAVVTVSVGSQLSGQIRELKADFNSEVSAGDVLAILDDKTYVARVAQAKADFEAAKAMLLNQEAAVERGEAIVRQAERALERQRTLAGKGIASSAALDTATRDIDVARADVAVAKAQVANAKAMIAQRQAALDQAEIDLDRTRIRSPINGTVISRSVDIGQTVAASLQAPELFKIAQDTRNIQIEAQVNEVDVGQVKEGNAATFTVDAYPDREFQGRVGQVRLAATELQNVVTYTVIVEAKNDDRRLFPGMTANVQIETARRDDVLKVASDALRFRPRDAGRSGGEDAKAKGAERRKQNIERLRKGLDLSDDQVARLEVEMGKAFQMARAQAESGDGGSVRDIVAKRIETVLGQIVTEAQRPKFEAWRAKRNSVKAGTVWVLKANAPERRQVQVGVSDDQSTEIVGGQLAEGEKVVLRARAVKK